MLVDAVKALRAQHEAQGLRLHARTACPAWLGERLDLGWAIDVLHPLATRAAGQLLPRAIGAVIGPPLISEYRHLEARVV
jgi:hypothetical protein